MKISFPQPAIIKKIIKENFRTKTFVTDQKIKAKPGQFIMIWLPKKTEKPFSLMNDNPLTFTVMSVGLFTKSLNTKIKKGDKIWYRGPFGRGVFKNIKGKKIIVSGGCGCILLYFLSKQIKNKKITRIIVGAKTKKELLFHQRFKRLGFKTIITTDDGSAGKKGLTTDILEKILQQEKISCVYGCGPEPMLKKVAKICEENKTKYQISLESIIKCGFGVCGNCVLPNGELVCLDGPVFDTWPKDD